MKDFLILFDGIWFVLLVGIIIFIANLVNSKGYMMPMYHYLEKRIKSKRLLLFLVSCLSGVFPIPGRTIISAAMLDAISPNDERRKHFGIINYLSSHHYYLWSPLEASVLIPISVLGISYLTFISSILPLLITLLLIIFYYVFFILKESDVVVNKKFEKVNYKKVKWNLLLYVFIVIVLSNVIKLYSDQITDYIINNSSSIFLAGVFAFISNFILGSSGKFAGIVSLLTTAFGIDYLILFFSLGYSGYLLSPTHKCLIISKKYFNLSMRHYLVLATISIILMLVGILSV